MTPLPDAFTNVAAALEQLSAALATGRPDAVLAAEEPLGAAVRQLIGCAPPAEADRTRVMQGIRTIRVALVKCQLLGRASASLEQAMAPHTPYTAAGYRTRPSLHATLESRT